MKKCIGILLTLTLLVGLMTAVPASAAGTNLVTNPSFTTSLDGWSGANGFHVTTGGYVNLTKANTYMFQWVKNLEEGATYTLSFDYVTDTDARLELIPGVFNAEITAAVTYPYIYFPASATKAPNAPWGKANLKITIPEGGKHLQIGFRANEKVGKATDERLVIDNVSLCLSDKDDNLGFENQLTDWIVSSNAETVAEAYDGNFGLRLPAGGKGQKIVQLTKNAAEFYGCVKTTAGATAKLSVTPLWSVLDGTVETIAVSSSNWKTVHFGSLQYTPSATQIYPALLEVSVEGEGEAYFDEFLVDYKGVNLVPNGSFENGAAGWIKHSGGSAIGNNVQAGTDAVPAPAGTKYLAFTHQTEGTSAVRYVELENKIPVTAGKYYDMSFWVKDEITRSQVQIPYFDSTGTQFSGYVYPYMMGIQKKTNGWRKFHMVFQVPKKGTKYGNNVEAFSSDVAYLNILLRMSAKFENSTDAVYYDDVSLKEIDGYHGFYDDSIAWKHLFFTYSNLGEKVETLIPGTYSFRFENTSYAKDSAFVAVGLYAKGQDNVKRLVSIKAVGEVAKTPYYVGTSTTDLGTDAGFKVPVTITEEDLADDNLAYSLEAMAWDGVSLTPIVNKTVIR